jgi:DNA-binding LacI/PurR family transcriptional regulator
MPKRRPVTIIEVARRAGVSPSTVSRVMNGTAPVVPETEQRVRAAIAEFNFSPHPAARQLVTQRTNMIGVMLPEISGAFFQPMLKGIEAGVREAGFDLLIYSTQNGRATRQQGEHITDGLIIFPGSVDDTELVRLYQMDFPVVLLHKTPPFESPYPFVTVENKSGAEMLINHLIEVHHRRRIIYLRGPASHEDSLWRERGYLEALENHGIPFDSSLVADGGFDEIEAFSMLESMLAAGLDFDAVFAGDDDAAAGVILALRQAGREVPRDVSVVGFDDVPFSRFINPPLTTVRAPIEQVGREAVRILVKLIQNNSFVQAILLPTELVIRQSCGCGE